MVVKEYKFAESEVVEKLPSVTWEEEEKIKEMFRRMCEQAGGRYFHETAVDETGTHVVSLLTCSFDDEVFVRLKSQLVHTHEGEIATIISLGAGREKIDFRAVRLNLYADESDIEAEQSADITEHIPSVVEVTKSTRKIRMRLDPLTGLVRIHFR